MKYLNLLFVVFLGGCLHSPKIAMTSIAEVEVSEDLTRVDRQDLYEDNKMIPGQASSQVRNLSWPTMVQGSRTYVMQDYLPALQEQGIAEGVQSPGPLVQAAEISYYAWFLTGFAGSLVGTAYLMDQFFKSDDEVPGYLFIVAPGAPLMAGYGLGYLHSNYYLGEAKPIFEQGHKKARKWSREYNRKLAKKLGIFEAPAADQGNPSRIPP